jgi:predicted metal-binding membrane protein
VTALALRRVGWNHPELGAAIYAVVAWLLLIELAAGGDAAQTAHSDAHRTSPLLADALGWFVMCVAMMVPSALLHARHLALSARWQRRQRTVAMFLASYLSVWTGFGLLALAAAALLKRATDPGSSMLLALGLAAAAVWAFSPWKWRSLRACHMIAPLPPDGPKADAACAAAGLRYGRLCLVASWPLMLATAIAGHTALLLMALASVILAVEKVAMRPIEHRRMIAAVLIAAAALVVFPG